jgi:hypothetical protein
MGPGHFCDDAAFGGTSADLRYVQVRPKKKNSAGMAPPSFGLTEFLLPSSSWFGAATHHKSQFLDTPFLLFVHRPYPLNLAHAAATAF